MKNKGFKIFLAFCFIVVFVSSGFANHGEADFTLGMSYYKQRRFLLSIGSFQKAIDAGYREPEVYFYLANAFREIESLDSAIQNYQLAIDMSRNNRFRSTAMVNLANAYYAKRDFTNAIQTLNRAYNLNRNLGQVFWFKGLAYFRLHDKTNTIKEWENYLALLPDGEQSDNIRKILAILKAEDFRFPDVVAKTDTVSTDKPDTSEPLLNIEGVLDELRPVDRGKASDFEFEDIEK
jgi:tetratricopeptide (TPR) repeat protein